MAATYFAAVPLRMMHGQGGGEIVLHQLHFWREQKEAAADAMRTCLKTLGFQMSDAGKLGPKAARMEGARALTLNRSFFILTGVIDRRRRMKQAKSSWALKAWKTLGLQRGKVSLVLCLIT